MGGDLGLDGMTPGGPHAPTPHPSSRAGDDVIRRWQVEVTFVVEAKSAEDAEQQVLDAIDGGSSTLSSYYGVVTAESE